MNRLIAALAALSLAPAALAQDATATQEAAPAPDVAALEGKIASLEEQVAEMKSDVSGLKRLKLSGYVQARYAWQEATDYNASPDAAPSQTNFFIRRGRLKAAYDAGWSQYVLQIDATPSGVSIKEGYATVKLPKIGALSGLAIDAGLQLFPFGYEVLVRSSSDLDLLERARVTRFFLAGEYDLGVALRGAYGPVNFKVCVFNGNGIDAGQTGLDNDNRKDVIGRVGYDLGFLTGGFSGWYGKTVDYGTAGDQEEDRVRFGADAQVFLELLPIGGTAIKGEYVWGKTGIGNQTLTPASGSTPADTTGGAGVNLGKTASGWYLLGTQNVGQYNQVAVRYEQFIPNHAASGTSNELEKELQVAVHTFIGGNYKLSAAWFHPLEFDRADGSDFDPKADQWIVQAQAKF